MPQLDQLPRNPWEDVSVVLVGIEPEAKLDRNARRTCEEFMRAGLQTFRLDYSQLHRLAKLELKDKVVIWPFFPHQFWDEHCEEPEDTELYGTSLNSFRRFQDFCLEARQQTDRLLIGKQVTWVVDLARAYEDRDKLATNQALERSGVPTAKQITLRSVNEILQRVNEGVGIFIKCRFGAEGKGITYLNQEGWWTNYRVDSDSLANYGVRDLWQFTEITYRRDLLGQLLTQEVVIEEEIVTPEIDEGTKFDLRAYVISGEVPHLFLRINARDAFVTNFSQGAVVEHRYAEILPPQFIRQAKSLACQAATCLETPFVGVDLMLDRAGQFHVIETQVFTDYPDPGFFNLPVYMAGQVRSGRFGLATR